MNQDENQIKIIKDINSDINLISSLIEKDFKIRKDTENINQEILIYESNLKLITNKDKNIMKIYKEKNFEFKNVSNKIRLKKMFEDNFVFFQENNNTLESKDITFEIENNKLNFKNVKISEYLDSLLNSKEKSLQNSKLFLADNSANFN